MAPGDDTQGRGAGALVISLDFELHWGVRDWAAVDGPYGANLLGARRAIPRMLDVFAEHDVGATWATVGFLFAASRAEVEAFSPSVRPRYRQAVLSPYEEVVGETEADDPYHLAASMVDLIAATPRQEVACHTFSHYYCLEPGTDAASLRADLESALRIARNRGIELTSLVFPGNQFNPDYLPVLAELGFRCYRGEQPHWIYKPRQRGGQPSWLRMARLADAYVNLSGSASASWDEVVDGNGLCNIPAGRFLRPYSPALARLEPLRLRRVTSQLEQAARNGRVFHLWWHPHNFGAHLEENLAFLRRILETFTRLRDTDGMRSLTMRDVGELAGSRRR